MAEITLPPKPCKRCGSRERSKTRNRCTECHRRAASARYTAHRGELLAKHKVFRDTHKELVSARKKADYARNKAAVAAKWKATYPERRERHIAYNAARYAREKEKLLGQMKARRALHLDRERERARRWIRENYAKKIARNDARRALKKAAPGTHTGPERLALTASYHRLCVYCLQPATTLDHVVPLARGGSNDIGNMVPACRRCNFSKHDVPLLLWLTGRPVRRPQRVGRPCRRKDKRSPSPPPMSLSDAPQ